MAGVLNVAGALEPASLAAVGDLYRASVNLFLGCDPFSWRAVPQNAEPVSFLDRDDPPVLGIYGTEDWVVPPGVGARFQAAADQVGARSRLVVLNGADHGTVGTDLPLDLVLEWLQDCLGAAGPVDTTVPDTTVPDTTVPTVPDMTVPTVPDTTDTTVPDTTQPPG